MTVSKEVARLEHSAVKLTVTIAKDDVRTEYDKLINEYSKTLQIPGFRKGKVPREVLVRKFGDAFKGEALGHIIEGAVTQVFEDESFPKEDRPLPYSTPQLQDEPPALDLDADLKFSVVYDVLPKITVGPWKGLTVEADTAKVEDEDLTRELDAIRDRNAIVMDKDDAEAAAKGDVVTVNYAELSDAGEPVAGTEREDFVFTLGTGYNVFKFDDDVAGMKKGETKDITKTYPETEEDKDLAGKTKKIRVTVTAVKERQLPKLDDDLAQDVDEKFKTLEDLKTSIRDRLTRTLEKRLRDIKISRILEKVMEATPADIPESMVRIELDTRWRTMARQFGTDAEQLTQLMERSGKGRDAIFEEWRPEAVKALHSRLIVETLIQDQKLAASGEETEKEFETIAAESDTSVEDVKKYYEQQNMREYLAEDIKERKLFDLLLAENTIKPGKKAKYVDLISNNG
ncbi:trigger factor [Spirochaetia bacterium]|nr:trigger factor [Spirochaetia bacterium]